ncbi:MAG: hypothetical protein Q9216_000807 [Gyalolechia sp. 2 TL-2023]
MAPTTADPTATTGGATHHIPAPTQMSEAKSIDLNPSTPAPAAAEPTSATSTTEVPKPTATSAAAPAAVSTGAAATGTAVGKGPGNEGGMSATSGPLDDPMARGYADVGVANKGVEEEGLGKKGAVAV